MRPLTDVIPKPMIPYKGDTLIGTSLRKLSLKVSLIHVTVGYKKSMLSQYLIENGVNSILNTEGHGNAWWISNSVMQYVDEPLLVLTTDNITEIDVDFLSREYVKLSQPACMLVPVEPIPGIDGDFIHHENGTVLSVNRNNPSAIYCTGIQVLNPAIISSLIGNHEDFYSVWNSLIAKRQLKVASVYPYLWFSIDTIEQLTMAESEEI